MIPPIPVKDAQARVSIIELREALEALKTSTSRDSADIWKMLSEVPKSSPAALEERLTAVEAKVGQLWAILTEIGPTGRPKPSRLGRSLYSKLQGGPR